MMVAAGSLEIIFGISMIAVSARAIDKGSKTQVGLALAMPYANKRLTVKIVFILLHSSSDLTFLE